MGVEVMERTGRGALTDRTRRTKKRGEIFAGDKRLEEQVEGLKKKNELVTCNFLLRKLKDHLSV